MRDGTTFERFLERYIAQKNGATPEACLQDAMQQVALLYSAEDHGQLTQDLASLILAEGGASSSSSPIPSSSELQGIFRQYLTQNVRAIYPVPAPADNRSSRDEKKLEACVFLMRWVIQTKRFTFQEAHFASIAAAIERFGSRKIKNSYSDFKKILKKEEEARVTRQREEEKKRIAEEKAMQKRREAEAKEQQRRDAAAAIEAAKKAASDARLAEAQARQKAAQEAAHAHLVESICSTPNNPELSTNANLILRILSVYYQEPLNPNNWIDVYSRHPNQASHFSSFKRSYEKLSVQATEIRTTASSATGRRPTTTSSSTAKNALKEDIATLQADINSYESEFEQLQSDLEEYRSIITALNSDSKAPSNPSSASSSRAQPSFRASNISQPVSARELLEILTTLFIRIPTNSMEEVFYSQELVLILTRLASQRDELQEAYQCVAKHATQKIHFSRWGGQSNPLNKNGALFYETRLATYVQSREEEVRQHCARMAAARNSGVLSPASSNPQTRPPAAQKPPSTEKKCLVM